MKGRSYRFSSTEPHEDWVDGSWTVDCVCGVNFDDGEEMVNCDECGVWVHTRCSRYVKGEELFTCDKCKSKNSSNDSEETEVAQLLVELPSKTLRMENSYARNMPLRRSFRLWTEIPMEERVHVQGVPGGDPALFEGLSSVFSRELWKSTGYVPKKFNIKYREFPCWDKNEKEKDETENAYENGHQADDGAGVLFSMSKENVLVPPDSVLVGPRGLDGKEANLKLGRKDNKKWKSNEVDRKRYETGMKKEKSLLHPWVTNKRKKDELVTPKDRIKKKVKVTGREADEKKGIVCKSVFRPSGDSKPLESHKDRDQHAFSSAVGNIKNEKLKENIFEESIDNGLALNNGGDLTSNAAIQVECSKGMQLSDCHAHGTRNQDDKAGHHVRIVLKSSASNDPPFLERKDVINNQAKEERHSTTADTEDNAEDSVGISVKPHDGRTDGMTPEVEGKRFDNVNGNISISTVKNEMLKQLDESSNGGAVGQRVLESVDPKGAETCAFGTSDLKIMAPGSSHTDDLRMQGLDAASERVRADNMDTSDELSSYPSQAKQELLPLEGSVLAQKDTTEPKPELGSLQEPSKSSRPFPAYSKPKVVVSIGKSSSTAAAMPKSYSFDNLKRATSKNSVPDSKQQPSNGHTNGAPSELVKERNWDDVSRKALKGHPKYSTSSRLTQQGRIFHSSLAKRSVPESTAASSSSKASSAPTAAGSAGSSGSPQDLFASQSQNKQLNSGISQKSEKPTQPISQSSTKNPVHLTQSLASNPSATLSDEELALLLHQELNSSPRVPRVPRMRQHGSLPQLASPGATSLLIKRASSSGSKDYALVSRRKNKDASKDGSRSSRDIDNKGMKSCNVRYSPDWKVQDSGNRGSICTKGEENEASKTLHSSRRVLPPSSTTSTSSGPSSSNEVNEHSMTSPRSSPQNTSDDAPVHQTLPGLINEIMSKGRRMTYEELCNAVLPHWPHLRKHNGERYAYSSHSQAVLDCLRNRHEWARLVDRGPKTNSSRRKRKNEGEESDGNKSSKGRETDEGGGKREDFPKGKRKARKRRRLGLGGLRKKMSRGGEEGLFSEEEVEEEEEEEGPFSESSDENISSEDDDEVVSSPTPS